MDGLSWIEMPFLTGRSENPGKKVSIAGHLLPRPVVLWFARAWIAAVVVGSLMPQSAKIAVHAADVTKHDSTDVSLSHRWIHFLAFGSSFLVLSRLAGGKREELLAAVEIVGIGCAVEVVQCGQFYWQAHRMAFEWWDIRDDAIGVAAALVLLWVSEAVRRASRN